MKKILFATLLSIFLLTPALYTADSKEETKKETCLILTISGAIGPATADYIHRGLILAKKQNAKLVIIKMDTPGGLDKSMRLIIKDIIASDIPVATYVSPSGARAASAGTYILYASHIAAMSPATNLGAATPVNLMGPAGAPDKPSPGKKDKKESPAKKPGTAMEKKIINDATAYIRGLAELHGRNEKWAVSAVTEAKSLPAKTAKKLNVIDIVATDVDDLLAQINKRKVKVNNKKITLETKDLAITHFDQDWRSKFLSVITSPDVAYMLMLAGIYGLFFEFSNPGFVLPGIVGGICILLALYALQMLPISYAGLGLIGLGLSLLLAEALIPSFGLLGIGGTVAFVIGSVLLIDTGIPGMSISWSIIGIFTVINVAFFLIVISLVWKAHRKPVETGKEELRGMLGVAMSDFKDTGQIKIHGEIWEAKISGEIKKGQDVRVIKSHGLVLEVEANTENDTNYM